MGLFDVLFGNKDEKDTQSRENEFKESDQDRIVKYATSFSSEEMSTDKETVAEIAQKIIAEDPFQKEYGGKTKEEITPLSGRVYKYQEVTTVNADIREGKDLYIEGKKLGPLSEERVKEIEPYKKDILMAYVYVTKGPYLEYSKESEQMEENVTPYELDIYT